MTKSPCGVCLLQLWCKTTQGSSCGVATAPRRWLPPMCLSSTLVQATGPCVSEHPCCCHWCASIPAQHCVPAQKMTSSSAPSARHGASLAVATVSVPTQDGQGMQTCQLGVCELTAHVRRAGTTTAAQLVLTGGWTGTVRDGAVAAATLQPWPTKQKPPSLDSVSRPCLGLLLEE